MSIFKDVLNFIKSTCRCCVRYMDDEPQRPPHPERSDSPASVTIIDDNRRETLQFNHSISIVVNGDVRVLHQHQHFGTDTPPPSPRIFVEEDLGVIGPQLGGQISESKIDM